jgi:hypothetical protein
MLLIAEIAFAVKMSSRVTRMSFALEFLSQRYKTPLLLESGNTGFVNINRFDIVPKIGDTQIPAGLLGIHKARIIHLVSCGNNNIEIDRNAFRSSATTMEEFFVYDCNVASLFFDVDIFG